MPKKTKTVAKLVEDAAKELQLLVRLKAADDNGYVSCVTCGKTSHYKDGMEGGHYIPRGKMATKILEENIHPQCTYCNRFNAENAKLAYRRWMDDYYGPEFVEELERMAKEPKRWYRAEVEEMIKDFREQIKEHKARVGG